MIERRFIDVGGARVHYRTAGTGPALLLVHQSPRSSAEYEPLIARWAPHFTVIAPDTAGFGQSQPLPGAPEIEDYARWLLAVLDALGVQQVSAYGFHSGAVILATALRLAPARFTAVAMGGYAVWTAAERHAFADAYLPPLVPTAYGEHLTWLWRRMLEQSWVFPWYDTNAARLPGAHAEPARVHAAVMEMLDAGDAYRAGYGAVLRAPRDLPGPGATTPPALITAYDGDPLQAHLARLGPLSTGWQAHPVPTPAAHEAASLALLRAHPAPVPQPLPQAADEGFVHVAAGGFDGRLHWRGRGDTLHLHAPGAEARDVPGATSLDLPGHGLSDGWTGGDLGAWRAVVAAAAAVLGASGIEGEGWSAALADPAAARPDAATAEAEVPDLSPDPAGTHLTRAWHVVRTGRFFQPWYRVSAETACRAHDLAPAALERDVRALLRATGARALLQALSQGEA